MTLSDSQLRFARAGLAVLARDGMAAVSFRTVAREAGMSVGAVQKAFPAKTLLLEAMFGELRASAALPALGDPGRPSLQEWLVGLALRLLPLDRSRRETQRQADAFGALAVGDAGFAAALRREDDDLLARLASLVRRAVAEGEVRADVQPEVAAQLWMSLVGGLAAQLMYAPRDEDDVRVLVECAVRSLVPRPTQ